METELTSILDAVASLKTGHRTGPRKAKNWLSPEAVDAKKQRRRLERRWKASNTEPDRLAYRAVCSSANKLITTSFEAANLERINKAQKNPNVFGQPSNPYFIHPLPTNNFHLPYHNHWQILWLPLSPKIVSLKDSIASKLHGTSTPFDFDLPHSGEVLSDFSPVTPAEVSQLLRSMSNKSSPLDYIPTSLLKSCADTFSILISHLANLSFTPGHFSFEIQTGAYHTPVKKPGLPKSDLANFRPISNLNTIGKILERLALSRFFPHISKSPSFSPLQSAYRKFHSTETALLKLTNDILESIDSGKNYNSHCFGYVRSL